MEGEGGGGRGREGEGGRGREGRVTVTGVCLSQGPNLIGLF